jgi:hypothetical protein
MKKFIALFIVLAVLAPVVFAQDAGITFGGWGRGIFVPIRMVDPDVGDAKAYAGVGKWEPYPRVGFSVKGNAEQVGFQADLFVFDGGLTSTSTGIIDPKDFGGQGDLVDVETSTSSAGISVGDYAYIWVKPWDFLKISVGKFNDDTLRGKIGDGNFDNNITLVQKNADAIFNRFQGKGLGAEVALTPIEGLYIAAVVNAGGFPTQVDLTPGEAKYVYEKIQIGAGYEIANIGHARAQFVGDSGVIEDYSVNDDTKPKETDGPRVEVAFALTAVENLLVDLGAKIWFPANKVYSKADASDVYATEAAGNDAFKTNPIGISVGARYTLDAFSITGRVDAEVAGSEKSITGVEKSTGLGLNAHLIPSYDLGFATVGADIGFLLNPEEKTADVVTTKSGIEFGLGAWIQKGLGNGFIKTGVGVKLPTEAHADAGKTDLVLTIPVILEYTF